MSDLWSTDTVLSHDLNRRTCIHFEIVLDISISTAEGHAAANLIEPDSCLLFVWEGRERAKVVKLSVLQLLPLHLYLSNWSATVSANCYACRQIFTVQISSACLRVLFEVKLKALFIFTF